MGKNRKEQRAKQQTAATSTSKSTAVDIPEEEQWRIIKESGILKQVAPEGKREGTQEDDEDGDYEISPLADEVFRALYLAIPMSFLLLLMEMYVYSRCSREVPQWVLQDSSSLIHNQYGRHASLAALRDRMLPGVPSTRSALILRAIH